MLDFCVQRKVFFFLFSSDCIIEYIRITQITIDHIIAVENLLTIYYLSTRSANREDATYRTAVTRKGIEERHNATY